MEEHTPDPIDVLVGERIRARRHVLEMSQQSLAAAVDVSFQQIQKYERGTNRVSASTLVHIAQALGCEPWELLPSVGRARRPEPINDAHKVLTRPEGVQLMRALARVPTWAYRLIVHEAITLDVHARRAAIGAE